MLEPFPIVIIVPTEAAGERLDRFLTTQLDVSRARVQELIHESKVQIGDAPAKASVKLRGGEHITIADHAQRPAPRGIAEDIPLDILYEDNDLAVINKPAGMMVHAGAGATEDARNRGTLVNALLHHFSDLSGVGGEMRPGIVHRLDKETSGLIVVAKNDEAHRKLAAQFARREVKKTYLALVHGWVKQERGTISQSISRDPVRRIRMTTRLAGGRTAISHYLVVRRLETAFGKFTLVQVKIDTGRTHQIRVHMSSLGHPIVGDYLYGALRELQLGNGRRSQSKVKTNAALNGADRLALARNFLHAAELELIHPRTAHKIALQSPLPLELSEFLEKLEANART
jgi:23S rRNA pseudouridine1911/1915/1917 synthase